jgi:succinyl-CoA synthetase beta subunit
MNIHEYQAKALLHEFGVPISRGVPVLKASDSDAAAKTLPGPIWVVKSQIHAGGRGKGKFKEASAGDKGGVRIAKSVGEVNEFAKQMLGATLVTIQTGAHGKQVNRLYIEEGSDIDKEFYLSILVDRETSEVSFVVSTEGGVNIEEVAHNNPEKIVTFSVDPATGIMGHHGRTVAKALNLSGDLAKQAEKLVAQLYNAFVAKDMAMLEINPLVVTKQGQLRVLDATRPRRMPRKSRRRNTTSTTSRSTAPSAAWSTAPALPWPPWTSSSSTAWSPPTFSTSAVAPARRRWRRPSRSSPRTRT